MNTSNLSKTANVVLSYLVSKSVNNSATLTYSEMMNGTGIGSKNTLIKALYQLEQNSLITRESLGRNKPTLYTVEPLKSEPLKSEPLIDEPLKSEPLKSEPLKSEPLIDDDDEYDDYELYHPNEKMSHNTEMSHNDEYDDDPEPTPVEPNYNVNPWDDEPYNRYLDEKEAWERRQKEKAQPKYNFSLWGKLLAIRDFDTNRIEGFYFYTYEGLERAEDFGKKYHSPILRKLPTHALMDQCVKGNGEFGVLSCYDMNFTFSECNEKPSWVTNKV